MTNEIRRKIAIKDYYGKGKHVYQDEMGFRKEMKDEARSLVSREVFRYHIEQIGLNLGFYCRGLYNASRQATLGFHRMAV